jgi:K+-sensing histidine kinase KdpD
MLPSNRKKSIINMGEGLGAMERGRAEELHIEYNYSRMFQVPSLPSPIFWELVQIGGLSLMLLTAVVVLFFIIVNSAQKQRKIAELRADLVNNISHELKTPLSSMSVALKTLALPCVSADAFRSNELLIALERQHSKLNRTVERVLESAVQQDEIELETFDISKFLKQYQDDLFMETHSISISIQPGSCYVKGTQGSVEAAIDNLIENAQKFSRTGSGIHIRGKQDGTRYRIDVVDAGFGIAKESQKNLFEKFYRVPGKDQRAFRGLGLGLFLSREGIMRTGGDLQLTSSSSTGSIFTIYLLLA